MNRQANDEFGTMAGLRDQSNAEDYELGALSRANADNSSAESQLTTDANSLSDAQAHVKDLLGNGPVLIGWNATRYIKNEIVILAIALAAFVLTRPIGRRIDAAT